LGAEDRRFESCHPDYEDMFALQETADPDSVSVLREEEHLGL
jgi:hypothetical protein